MPSSYVLYFPLHHSVKALHIKWCFISELFSRKHSTGIYPFPFALHNSTVAHISFFRSTHPGQLYRSSPWQYSTCYLLKAFHIRPSFLPSYRTLHIVHPQTLLGDTPHILMHPLHHIISYSIPLRPMFLLSSVTKKYQTYHKTTSLTTVLTNEWRTS